MTGHEDLDNYGDWSTAADYGAVWYPRSVAADWAPYRYGRWAWVEPWGWTWVDAAPWGFAPFHYGRWVQVRGRWGWAPGAYVARPVWAPALVGWYGGSGWSVSVNVGGPVYGWVPLAWGEPFRPWWNNCSYRCWTHFNRPYAVRTDDRTWREQPTRFRNVDHPGGITAVPGAATTVAPENTTTTVTPNANGCTPGTHEIVAGDLPGTVAAKYDVTVAQLDEANVNTKGYTNFIVGVKIVIPCP